MGKRQARAETASARPSTIAKGIAGDGTGEEPLSLREIECLQHIANGERIGRIACLLDVAEVTIEYHLRNCRAKLGAQTRDQAVAIAVSRGLVKVG